MQLDFCSVAGDVWSYKSYTVWLEVTIIIVLGLIHIPHLADVKDGWNETWTFRLQRLWKNIKHVSNLVPDLNKMNVFCNHCGMLNS